ncbi:MAG: RNA polymerase sigma factor [Deltaproteobacteria bacterium]|nr:RNA polymerase sigma factor [Deltaproteobacteria bacterium]
MADRIAEIYQAESRRVLATLIRLLGDFDQAEEALQEAFSSALSVWPKDGIPEKPRAWLVSAGKFRGLDAMRRQGRGKQLARQQAEESPRGYTPAPGWDGDVVKDDLLRLIFTCCHPALPTDSRIALALRSVCGLTTAEIASAFLVPEGTMKKRISRAKAKIREEAIPYEVPTQSELPARLGTVLHVVYLVYNEGYSATEGTQHQRRDLASDAVFLSRLIADLLPEPEALGLHALLLLHESRSAVRIDDQGDVVPLGEQDRALWNQELIAQGVELVQRTVMSGRLGPYGLQAAIATVHAAADSLEATNWGLIVEYYDLLIELQESPIVELSRAIAIGMRDGPEAGIALIEALLASSDLASYHRAHAAKADLARRAGFLEEARESYRRAVQLVRQEPERRYLEKCLMEISR